MRNYVLFQIRRIQAIFNGSPQTPYRWSIGETESEVEFRAIAIKDAIAGVPRDPQWTFVDLDYYHTDDDGNQALGIYIILKKAQVVDMLSTIQAHYASFDPTQYLYDRFFNPGGFLMDESPRSTWSGGQ